VIIETRVIKGNRISISKDKIRIEPPQKIEGRENISGSDPSSNAHTA
jgi:hypothetical protein